jgi:hypothetical protein
MRVEFSNEAKLCLQEIDGYYCDRSARMANLFLSETEKLVETIRNFPDTGILYKRRYRLFPLTRFPYLLVCEPYVDFILVLTIIHNSRAPKLRVKRVK